MRELMTLGAMLAAHARLRPEAPGVRDLGRALTFRQWNARACRLANALLGLGLMKGDRVAVLAWNRLEWAEIYAGTAKAGLVAVPLNFRLVAGEVRGLIQDAEAAALLVEDGLAPLVEEIAADLPLPAGRIIQMGAAPVPAGRLAYEALLEAASDREPGIRVAPGDPWTLMYTSGTTGRPKGVLRSHEAASRLSLVTAIELSIRRQDDALLVMPMCHANSLNFFAAFSYAGAATTIHAERSFDPERCVRALASSGATFTSLVPTQYIMMLALPEAVRGRHELGRVSRLMISSAPARPDTKRAVMAMFRNSGLFELYGSSEAGWVTMLHPEEQLTKLGSVGRECIGSAPVRLLDADGNEVADGEAGELFSATPYSFDRYWKLPEKTKEAFRDGSCTVGDMARRDPDGYLHLVDRKSNMIISGGENIYPSEVEAMLGGHPAVKDVAVIGLPDPVWGERVHAVVTLHDGAAADEALLLHWCRDRIAGYKRPRSLSFLREEEMPRTATGKVLHRALRTLLAPGPAATGEAGR